MQPWQTGGLGLGLGDQVAVGEAVDVGLALAVADIVGDAVGLPDAVAVAVDVGLEVDVELGVEVGVASRSRSTKIDDMLGLLPAFPVKSTSSRPSVTVTTNTWSTAYKIDVPRTKASPGS